MVKRKNIRKRGKIPFSRAFQEFEEGDFVSVIAEDSVQPRFPESIQGRTGIVSEKRGRSFLVKIMDSDKEKIYILNPIHLKKIKKMESVQ